MAWFLVIATVVSLVAGGGVAYAADDAVPGDALYGVDRAMEELRLKLTSDPEETFDIQLRLAEERLGEARALYVDGERLDFNKALAGYGESFSAALKQAMGTDEATGEALRLRMDEAIELQEQTFALMETEPASEGVQIQDRDRDRWCLPGSEEVHPVIVGLSEVYTQTVTTMTIWFCEDGHGLGEIMHAISMSPLAGVDAGALLGERETGNGWGQIMQDYDLVGGPLNAGPWHTEPVGPGQGEPNDGGSNKPEEPGNKPAEPGNQPEEPGNKPEEPGNKPEEPGNKPAEPGNQPEGSGDQPEDAGNQPEDPGNQPEEAPGGNGGNGGGKDN